MIAISWYILKVLIVSGILTGYYYLALKDKVFHRWNRFYLLLTVCLSLLLPLVSINIFSSATEQGNISTVLQTITMQDQIVVEIGRASHMNSNPLWIYGYLLTSLFFVVRLIISLMKIVGIRKRYPNAKVNGVNFINTDEKGTPFSFFNDIFWNRSIDLHTTSGQQIFNHEVAHITEKHTYDKLFMNSILLLFWINPFFWIIRKELYMIHEFIADKMALEDGDTNAFAEMILTSVFTRQQFAITNHFFYSPLKRRLLMLTKNKHTKVNYISRLLVLPLAAIVFIGISCKVKMDTENQKPIDNLEANVPVESESNLLTDSMPTMYNDNKKIVGLDVITPRDNPPLAKVTYEDGSKETLTFEEAEAKGIVIPPPPPPPAQIYNGKIIKYITSNTTENQVYLTYTDGTKEEITFKEAENAKLKFAHYTPPKITDNQQSKNSERVPKATPKNTQDSDSKVFTKVQKEASFPGGNQKWSQYISRAITADIDKFGENDYGTCVVKFIVDSEGNVSEVEATTMKGTLLAKVAIDAIRKGPKWIPATQNDIPVNAYRLQPVTLTNPKR